MRRTLACCLYVIIVSGGCAGTGATPAADRVPSDSIATGLWGGEHATLTLDASGGAIQYDCAHGGIRGPLRTDAAGRFDIAGFHVREHGGPVRIDEHADSLPARFVGSRSGDRMTLRVMVGPDTLGPFTLNRGEQGRVYRCL